MGKFRALIFKISLAIESDERNTGMYFRVADLFTFKVPTLLTVESTNLKSNWHNVEMISKVEN